MDFVDEIVHRGILEPVKEIPYWAFEKSEGTRKRQYTWKRTKWLGSYLLEGKETKGGDRSVALSGYNIKSGKLKRLLSATGLDKWQADQIFEEIEEIYKAGS